jgi:hypothetical protein
MYGSLLFPNTMHSATYVGGSGGKGGSIPSITTLLSTVPVAGAHILGIGCPLASNVGFIDDTAWIRSIYAFGCIRTPLLKYKYKYKDKDKDKENFPTCWGDKLRA